MIHCTDTLRFDVNRNLRITVGVNSDLLMRDRLHYESIVNLMSSPLSDSF